VSVSPLASPKAISSSVAKRTAGHGFGVLVQQLQDQSPEPLVATVEGVLTEQ